MSEKEKQQLNNEDMAQFRSLIGDASGDTFSLDDILSEYGRDRSSGRGAVPLTPEPEETAPVDDGPDLPWPEAPRRPRPERDNVVAFPGGGDYEQPEEAFEDEPPAPEPAPEESEADQVIPFPEEESVLGAFLKDIGHKANDYADRMFEEDERTDHEEVRRLEQLIPGTDREEAAQEDEPRRVRRAPRAEPPPPDTPPRELAREYGRGLNGLRVRSLLVFLLMAAALVQLLVPALGRVWPAPLDDLMLQRWAAVGLLALGALLSYDLIFTGLGRIFRLKVEMDSLAALAVLATLADGVLLALYPQATPDRLPYAAPVLAILYLHLHGYFHKRFALCLSCKTAAASSSPYRVTLDEGKWNGRNTYTKWSGDACGFGSQIQMDDGAQRIFHRFCPLLLLADILLSLLTSVAIGKPEQLAWCLSALFTVTAALGGTLVYGRPFHKLARRLASSGAALAGWPGVLSTRRGDRVLITDTDLFPPGYVDLNGYKVMPGFPSERVVAYTATLIRDSGSGLTKLFQDQLRAMGGMMRNAQRLCCYEGGGLSATIRGDNVLVGSAAFMNLMEVSLPQGLNVKNAVFCAINGELAGIFALNYILPDTAFPALDELMREKIGPVLATRDFNLIPAMLHHRFKLAADKMDFPPVERRRELSDPDQPHSSTLTALLCREGLYPFAEAITAAKRLRRSARLGAILCCVSSTLGLALCAYLTSVSAYTSLSPLSLLVYQVTWLLPAWLLGSWAHRY